jgi:hypothetical protein
MQGLLHSPSMAAPPGLHLQQLSREEAGIRSKGKIGNKE